MNKPIILFVFNPTAGGGKKKIDKIAVKSLWSEFEVVFIDELAARNEKILYHISNGVSTVIVAGGDGTVNEVASLVKNTSANLAIIPIGSGNGLARDLGIPVNVNKALHIARQGKVKKIDVGYLNQRPFFCTAGIGFDALCAYDFAHGVHSRGLWNYVKIVFKNYFKFQPVSGILEGERLSFFSLTFANAGQFGNDTYIAPDALIDDGFLDCSIILPHPKYEWLRFGWLLIRKKINKFKFYRVERGKRFSLNQISDLKIHIDGESVQLKEGKLEVYIEEKALNVIIP